MERNKPVSKLLKNQAPNKMKYVSLLNDRLIIPFRRSNPSSLASFVPQEVKDADVIFVSHSGGKDSQAMLSLLIRMGLKDKIVLVHSDLGEMEWEPMHDWIESISYNIPLNIVASNMDFFEMARKYKRLPSGMHQFCTDFLKTKPIAAFIHDYMTENKLRTAINATGMRAEESKRRAMKSPFQKSDMTQPKKYPDHLIHDWLPIFGYEINDVMEEIKLAGQKPHKIYSEGFSRLSCAICVNGRIEEHKKAAQMRPVLARKMAQLERDLGKTIRLKQVKGVKYPRFLDEYVDLTGVAIEAAEEKIEDDFSEILEHEDELTNAEVEIIELGQISMFKDDDF
jgi:DNA sulfur modification protein DndC